MINVFQPSLGREELERIEKVFASNWLGKGKLNDEFETGFAAHLNVDRKHVFTTNCCSEGLFSSMHMFDIGPGDEVVMPTISFVGADTETLLMALDLEGIAAASGSACSSGSLERSHVLKAMGLSDKQLVSVDVDGDRPVTFRNVVVRVKPSFRKFMHIDFDEANAAHIGKSATGVVRPQK